MELRRVARAAGIVAALGAVGGAVAGALAGVAVGLVILSSKIVVGPGAFEEMIAVGALVGGAAGALLAPLAGFGFLRHVPLWRALAFGVAGTLAGFGAGVALKGSVLGFTVAGIALGVYAARRSVRKVHRDHASGAAEIGSAPSVPELESAGPASEVVVERPPRLAAERQPPAT